MKCERTVDMPSMTSKAASVTLNSEVHAEVYFDHMSFWTSAGGKLHSGLTYQEELKVD